MACMACTSVPALPAASISVNYPTSPQKPGDFFDITVITTAGILTVGTYMVCLYESNVIVDTKSFWIQFGGSVTTVFTVRAISKDMKFNVSGVNVGLIWDTCDQFELFTVYATGPPPPPPKYYRCNPTTKLCDEDTTGASTDTLAQCLAKGCKPANGGDGEKCGTGKIGLFGQCYKTSDVAMVGGVAVLLFMMMRK